MHAADSHDRTYLALGDSMSIDRYTGVVGGGAASQFHRWLGDAWTLDDRAADMCRMRYVPTDARGDVITLTIGGNDLLAEQEQYIREGLAGFSGEHCALLQAIRASNPGALLMVGNVYAPQTPLPNDLERALDDANLAIAANVQSVGACLVDIRRTFRGHEQELLCFDIEPSLQGATSIAELFAQAASEAGIERGRVPD